MDIPVALILLGAAVVMWRSDLRLPGAILALVVAGTLAGDRTPTIAHQINQSLADGLAGEALLLVIVGFGFALCCGWRPGRSRPPR